VNTRIFKYELPVVPGVNQIRVHRGAVVVFVGAQPTQDDRQKLCVWARVDGDVVPELTDREFGVVGTSHVWTSDDFQYLGTVREGPFVWHVLERVNGP
jgi:hypothetical protein